MVLARGRILPRRRRVAAQSGPEILRPSKLLPHRTPIAAARQQRESLKGLVCSAMKDTVSSVASLERQRALSHNLMPHNSVSQGSRWRG